MGGVKDLLDRLGDAMKYVIIEDRLLEARRMKWQDGKMLHLRYYIANVNPPTLPFSHSYMSLHPPSTSLL